MKSINNKKYFHNINEIIENLLINYLSNHNKVLPVLFNVRYHQHYHYHQKKDISSLFDKINTYYFRLYYNPYYFWKREQNISEHHHYHCLLFLNGKKIQRIMPVFKTVERFWASTLGIETALGLVHYCLKDWKGDLTGNGTMLRRDDPELFYKLDRFRMAASYLAKTATSGFVNDGYRNFGCYRI